LERRAEALTLTGAPCSFNQIILTLSFRVPDGGEPVVRDPPEYERSAIGN
jgi:hypothetical protein